MAKDRTDLSTRERLGLLLILLALKIVGPWEYDHQVEPVVKGIRETLGLKP